MIGWAILAGIGAVHLVALGAAFLGPSARLSGGLFVIAANYGLRRLLFLDSTLGQDVSAWYGLILLGDFTLALIVVMSALRPARPVRFLIVDAAVLVLLAWTAGLVAFDDSAPLVVRLAHWKEEYFYGVAYGLVRLNGPQAIDRQGVLNGLAVVAVGVAVWQAVAGPLGIDLAWVASGRSVLVGDDIPSGAATLGNLGAGWLRPYGVFGNGTDFGAFLACIGLLAVARRLPDGLSGWPALVNAVVRPIPVLCTVGIILGVVRLTWAIWAVGLVLLALFLAAGGVRRLPRLMGLGGLVAALLTAFIVVSPLLATSDDLIGRAFVTGTYRARVEAQVAYLGHLADRPTILITGEGFGLRGSAARKFGAQPPEPIITHHSRAFDLIEDGGVVLLVLVVAPLLLSLRGGANGDPLRAAALAYALSFLLCATLLGAKSALLQTLFWAMIGVAASRLPDARSEAPCSR